MRPKRRSRSIYAASASALGGLAGGAFGPPLPEEGPPVPSTLERGTPGEAGDAPNAPLGHLLPGVAGAAGGAGVDGAGGAGGQVGQASLALAFVAQGCVGQAFLGHHRLGLRLRSVRFSIQQFFALSQI